MTLTTIPGGEGGGGFVLIAALLRDIFTSIKADIADFEIMKYNLLTRIFQLTIILMFYLKFVHANSF